MITGLDHYKNKWNINTDAAVKPGLQAITAALAELNNPHKKGNYIHIAGTNGKGSTAAFLAAILRAHGMSVGTFFSPCIEDLHDQIQLNGEPVSGQELDAIMENLSSLKTPLTDFELLTAAAFSFFESKAPDFAIIEAGMGGRFDSTNVINPTISIIPSISMEHTNFLGTTIEEISWHKAGIIKKWKPVVIGNLPENAKGAVVQVANDMHAEIIEAAEPVELEMKLKGKHQKQNAALALEAAKELLQLKFDQEKADKALKTAVLPNRFEEIFPNLIFDGAHNEASAKALAETAKEIYPDKAIHFVMGILKDKDYQAVLSQLETVSGHFTFIDFENERALPAKTLFSKNRSKIKTIQNQYDILPVTSKNEVTIVTGSLYLLAILRNSDFSMFENYKQEKNRV